MDMTTLRAAIAARIAEADAEKQQIKDRFAFLNGVVAGLTELLESLETGDAPADEEASE